MVFPEKNNEIEIGTIIHYYPMSKGAVIKILYGFLDVGDKIHVVGNKVDFIQEVKSIQSNHLNVSKTTAEKEIALKMINPVSPGDTIYKIVE